MTVDEDDLDEGILIDGFIWYGLQPRMRLMLDRVSKTYTDARTGRSVHALDAVSLGVGHGEIVALVGPSGSGKSTLLDIAAGLTRPDDGTSMLVDRDIDEPRRLAYMPQRHLLLPWKRVVDNAALGLRIAGLSREVARGKARELMATFGLAGFEDAWPAELSGGMRQRAALLRTIISGSDTLLLDEPFGALDALTRMELQDWLLATWADFGWSILVVTHDPDEAIYLADRVYVLSPRPGRVVAEIEVGLDRPRQRSMMTSADFAERKRALLDALGVA